MSTKTITKKMIVTALKKDLVLLNKQKKATEDYIKAGCGQFLNVGNDEWCGGYKEVLRLYKDMIKFVNKAIVKLNPLKEGVDLLEDFWSLFSESTSSNEAGVFVTEEKQPYDLGRLHHGLLVNFSKLNNPCYTADAGLR